MSYTFYLPTKVIFSDKAVDDLMAVLDKPAEPVLFITDKGLVKAGIAEPFLTQLKESGARVVLHDDVPGNPNLEDVLPAVEAGMKMGCRWVVGLGGGSVLDTAKAAGIMLSHPGVDYEDLQWGRVPVTNPPFPVVCIPTTAGTGSEVTKVTVIGDRKGFKKGLLHPFVFARTAIVDGSLMLSLPANLTAATGMDVMVHAIEAFLGKRASPFTDLYALEAIRMVRTWLPEATANGSNLEARQQMAKAATMAGIAFDQSGLGLVHAICGPLAGAYHLHHGLGVAVLLPYTLDFDAPAISPERWYALSLALDLPDSAHPGDLKNVMIMFLETLGLPTRLGEVGLKQADIQAIAEGATRMAMIGNNVRAATADDCAAILTAGL
ncbi:MAG: iron-containing alcohol dehydrogenase [Anaerolineae bacterium]|nr:iron-containing alcohol dehydrogenase [Anaerolineae bacterium]